MYGAPVHRPLQFQLVIVMDCCVVVVVLTVVGTSTGLQNDGWDVPPQMSIWFRHNWSPADSETDQYLFVPASLRVGLGLR